MGHPHEDLDKRRAAAVRTAILLAGLALAVYVTFFFTKG
jgi:hypothetical protein